MKPPSNRIDDRFAMLATKSEKALIFFATAGDPSWRTLRETLEYCQDAGVDLIEIGVPFSDPLADGPVIQAAGFRALERGVNLDAILEFVAAERKRGLKLPIVLMSAFNPIFHRGTARCAARMAQAGVDGVIVPDLPLKESAVFRRELRARGLRWIDMVTPTTRPDRLEAHLKSAEGFLYFVSLVGLTGSAQGAESDTRARIQSLQKRTRVPVCAGFGISSPQDAGRLARFADGVIVGSALVRELAEHSAGALSRHSKALIRGFVRAVKKSG